MINCTSLKTEFKYMESLNGGSVFREEDLFLTKKEAEEEIIKRNKTYIRKYT